jgi:hypothetical protein
MPIRNENENEKNVKLLETDLDRKYFTKHGLLLNLSGNEQISLQFAVVIWDFF